MTTMISRLYVSRRRVEAALGELRNAGYRDVHRFGAGDGQAPPDRAAEVEAMRGIGLSRAQAEAFADRLASGHALIVVFAPFGKAQKATRILDQHEPVDGGIEAPATTALMPGDATPLSTALGLPVLAKTRLPFESTFGIPSLTGPGWFMTGGLGFGRANPAPFSSALGMPLLTKAAAPLSSMLGLACLSSNPTPLSSLLGLPTLKSRSRTAA
jgi:hypothetical protein